MDKLAQRIAIAETQGWSKETRKLWVSKKNVVGWGKNQHLDRGDKDRDFTEYPESFPDYLNDRNALIAAVLTLNKDQRKVFGRALANDISDLLDGYELFPEDVFDIVTAPLDKIAKAYLVATSKWRND